MCTRAGVVLCALLALAAPAAALEGPDAALVVVLLDGLVADCVDATFDGSALMPRTAAAVADSRRFTDVLTPSTNPGRAREQLRDALAGFGADAIRHLRTPDPDSLAAAVEALATRSGRQVLLLDLPWLEPPLALDEELLLRLDPAPWFSMTSAMEIETQDQRRLARARRLAQLSGRGGGRGRDPLITDVEWVIRAAHAGVDGRLGGLLEQLRRDRRLAGRATVVLTATSSTGNGERGLIGPFVGVALDVARVPVFVWGEPFGPGVDDAPRQWIAFDRDWFAGPGPEDRFTRAWYPAEGRQPPVCALRWTTPGFTLVDATSPRRPPTLYDLRLDPGEWFDRAVSEPALADSLRRAARVRLYGETPVVVFAAGEETVELRLQSRGRLEGPAGARLPALRVGAGEMARVRMVDGPESLEFGRTVRAWIGGEERELSGLILHSPAWIDASAGPGEGSGLRIWIE